MSNEVKNLSVGDEALVLQIASFDLKNYLCCSAHTLYLKNPQNLKLINNLPVASGKTFIGQTLKMDFNLIKVILFSDASHILPVKVNDLYCNAKGAGRPLLIICKVNQNIDLLAVKNNDIVFTSGLGGIFPRNTPIGRILSIKNLEVDNTEITILLDANPQENNFFGVLLSS